MLVLFPFFNVVVTYRTDDDAHTGIETCLTQSTTIIIQHIRQSVTWKFTNFTELQYEGVAEKQDAIHTHEKHMHACHLKWLMSSDLLEWKKCQLCNVTVHVKLVSQAQSYFTCTLCAQYRPFTRIVFRHFCKCHACCCNFNDCPSVQNHLLKRYCNHLSLPLCLILETAFLSILC